MTPSRLFIASLIASLILFGIPMAASAGPGDPRLVNGVLEWPRVVNNDPFFVVRGDDGVLYYVGVGAARREGALTAGSRVSVLGIEGRSAHEIVAVGIGSGPTAEAALAQLQSARPAAPAAPAPVAPVAPAPAAAVPSEPAVTPAPPSASPNTATPAPAAPARVVAPASVAPAAGSRPTAQATPAPRPSVAPTPAPAGAPGAPAVAQAAPAVAHAAPAVAAAPVTTSVASPAVVTASTTAAGRTVMSQPIVATAPMVPVDDRRWTELVGEVESLSGRTLVLRVDGGRVSVDVSSLSSNLERMVAPGSTVKVYGVPVELRFKAMGFIDPDARGTGR